MIQIISYSGKNENSNLSDIIFSKLEEPKSLDEFEFNLIDLSDENIWRSRANTQASINCINDLRNLGIMIGNSKKSTFIVKFPVNVSFLYEYANSSSRYIKSSELKNMLDYLVNILKSLIGIPDKCLLYENTSTNINGKTINASFYFNDKTPLISFKTLTISNHSKKITSAMLRERLIITTLNLKVNDVNDFLKAAGLINEQEDIPIWVKELNMFDDREKNDLINHNLKLIGDANKNIEEASKVIARNNELKSIIYSSGDFLVKIVFEILEHMLDCTLSGFEDKRQEDFIIEIGDLTFIGEIKGVNHNVKSENISQLDVHFQNYLDEHPDKNETNVKALLIMAHQKSKPLSQREPVHAKQVTLAERNKSLIVETPTLLRIYERYKKSEIDTNDCIKLLSENIGLLKFEE
jgi:hypothetical protein